ncbi:kinase [Thraustotheca clavata]|uniref:Kinase n=1 Tax=Thraustotheca clavata TaxID=74557 RepID=A0A1W0AA04_9STRA|nr:kinase [Thraustotheca clavata]
MMVATAIIIAYANALQACTNSILDTALSELNLNTLYCCGALGGTPCLNSSAYSCQTTKTIFEKVKVNETMTLSCSPGYAISDITFASYGTPNGTTLGFCHSTNSSAVIKSKCLSQQTCKVDAVNDVFGDPCTGIDKVLTVEIACAASTTDALGSQCPSGCSPSSWDIFRSSNSPFSLSEIACFQANSNCIDFMTSIQLALGKISPACYFQQTNTSFVSTSELAYYTMTQFLNFLQTTRREVAEKPASSQRNSSRILGSNETMSFDLYNSSQTNITTPVPTGQQVPSTTSPPITSLPVPTATNTSNIDPRPSNSTSVQTSDLSSTLIIVIVIAIMIVTILVAILIFCYCRNKKSAATKATQDMPEVSPFDEYQTTYNPIQPAPIRQNPKSNFSTIDMRDLELHYIPPNHLSTISVIANGAFGEVLLGDYQGQTVAIKKLLGHRKDLKQLQRFVDEICLVAKLDSPYIVQFKGASWTIPADIVLVTEFMDAGDLRTVLDNNSTKSFTWQHKVSCALDIVNALGYLHTLHTKIIHRDLKSRNVLLNSQMQAKVTDFGVSRETDDATMTVGIGTFRWMAPEALLDNYYTESADMFSFGVILAELSNEIVPYSDKKNANGRPYTDTAIMTQVMKGELLPSFAHDTPRWFYELGMKCLSLKPEDRPTALEAAHIIKQSV